MYICFFKRGFDIVFAVILFLLFPLLVLVVYIFIYLDDKGPLFYNAQRLGKNGRPFKMFKFRTMIVNAPDLRLSDGSTYNGDDDSRVTRVGHFLRRTSIDEIPQIINIFWGDMSFIGPRPDTIDWYDKYSKEEKKILLVRPGITGYNQAYYRNSVDGATKLKNDIYYVENLSIKLDIKILIKTVKTVLMRKNINVDHSRFFL